MDAAEKKAEENYESKKKSKKKKTNCDAQICVIFPCDEGSEWDEELVCHNGCRIHLRCEGKIYDEVIPDNYECEKCKLKNGNRDWLEEHIVKKKKTLKKRLKN